MFIQTVSSREHRDFHIGTFQEGLHALQFTKTAVASNVLRLGFALHERLAISTEGQLPAEEAPR